MAELLIRVGAQDVALIERVLRGDDGRPDRVVVDAHVARAQPRIRDAARASGIPFLIDPQTSPSAGLPTPGRRLGIPVVRESSDHDSS